MSLTKNKIDRQMNKQQPAFTNGRVQTNRTSTTLSTQWYKYNLSYNIVIDVISLLTFVINYITVVRLS